MRLSRSKKGLNRLISTGQQNIFTLIFTGIIEGKDIVASQSKPVFPNLLKAAEHLTIKLLKNPSYLESNFCF